MRNSPPKRPTEHALRQQISQICRTRLIRLIALFCSPILAAGVVAPGAELVQVGQGFQFTEGPAANAAGDVFFTDVHASRIHRWSAGGGTMRVFQTDTGNANGLAFGLNGNLFICEGANGRVTMLDLEGKLSVVADAYQGRRFNQPNDLWVAPDGGIYFSDPIYGQGRRSQDGEHMYYVSPDRKRVVRVIDDMQRPNGLIGTPDGRTLYVTDHGDGKTFRYVVNSDGTLSKKMLFCKVGSDGMTLDSHGNVYLTSDDVLVFDPAGRQVERIAIPERPTNVTFAGPKRKTLFITARTTVYTLAMNVSGAIPRSLHAVLPDTGQVLDTTPTHGEDSDYTIRQPRLTDHGDGTVLDHITGLTWQKVDGGEMTWRKARDYADALALGNYDDWRLPTAQELFGLLDHGHHEPAIDTNVFDHTSAQYWWTADPWADDSDRIWVANSGGGIGPHPASETLSAGGDKRFHVRCVRGSSTVLPAADLVNNGDGTVTDRRTGLVWQQQAEATAIIWEDALRFAERLTLAGHDDWRLPNIKELFSLVDVSRNRPALDSDALAGSPLAPYWSSTSEANRNSRAWVLEARHGIVAYADKTEACTVRAVRGGMHGGQAGTISSRASTSELASATATAPRRAGGNRRLPYAEPSPGGPGEPLARPAIASERRRIPRRGVGQRPTLPDGTVRIPGGTFQMGDHHDLGGREHRNDEVPIHEIDLDPFYIGRCEVTNAEYCRFLNSALKQRSVTVRSGAVSGPAGTPLYCETRPAVSYSHIEWNGTEFAVVAGKERHPVVCIRWEGAVGYCNWLSAEHGLEPCYDLKTWACDYAHSGYRLPTEAEWEYAGRGGQHAPYRIYPWGDDADVARANWPNSRDPYETGPFPWTTPVGFYNGELRTKADFGWPGRQATYQTKDGSNGYGLCDMAGNVWEWCNDWYTNTYYATGPSVNPEGPASGKPMPDGKPYRVLRSGNWYNGPEGHSRVSNRNPAHFRGPKDPDHPYYHIGFRIVRDVEEDGPRRQSGAPKVIGPVTGNASDRPRSKNDRRNPTREKPRGDDPRRNNRWGSWKSR